MDAELKSNLTRRSTWLRALYMLLFALIYSVAEIVLAAAVVIQLGFVLLAGRPNARLLEFGASLASFIYQVVQFWTFNSEELPFPFGAWPDGAAQRSAGLPPPG